MSYEKGLSALNGPAAVRAVNVALRQIDIRLMDHGERVTFIACELAKQGHLDLDLKLLYLLCAFHDIGAYKTDEIDKMVEFETTDVRNHSIYGYLFVKHLTPMGDEAEAILYHHTPWHELKDINTDYADYGALIHLADRIDIAVEGKHREKNLDYICNNTEEQFCPEYVNIFKQGSVKEDIVKDLIEETYKVKNDKLLSSFDITEDEALDFLKMVAYSIDFRSAHTVTHTINTVSIAVCIADHLKLTPTEYECVYLGALLHDVGKITIPLDILEFPGRLSDEQMSIMRTHVDQTEILLRGIVPEDILNISIRHHEKLDGSGYPRGLKGDDLDTLQRIVAVADITSALGSRRSYKEPFPKEKTIGILESMAGSQLDPEMCSFVCNSYDKIMDETDVNRNVIIKTYQSIMQEYELLSM